MLSNLSEALSASTFKFLSIPCLVITLCMLSQPQAANASVHCTVKGTKHNDVLRGTKKRDVICAGAGNDTIYGLGGNDLIYSGAGNDRVYGGDGNDTIQGDSGKDLLQGDKGNDIISGGDNGTAPSKSQFPGVTSGAVSASAKARLRRRLNQIWVFG